MSDIILRLPMQMYFVIVQINCNFIMMVGLANDDCCLFYNLHVEKCWGLKEIMNTFSVFK